MLGKAVITELVSVFLMLRSSACRAWGGIKITFARHWRELLRFAFLVSVLTSLLLYVVPVWLGSVLIGGAYLVSMLVIYNTIEMRRSEAPYIFLAYILTSACFCGMFAALYVGSGGKDGFSPGELSSVDGFYYSVVVFTSVGFGDIAPKTAEIKLLTSFEALLGAAHGFSFLTILAGKLAFGGADSKSDRTVAKGL